MKKRGLGIVGLIAIGAVLVLSGCGGGGNKPLTKEQFAAKVNALCVSFNAKNNAAGTPASLQEAVAQLQQLTPLYEKLTADLKKIKPPAGEAADVSRIITLQEKRTSLAKQVLSALQKNDVPGATKLIQSGNADSKEAKQLYNALGLTECAK